MKGHSLIVKEESTRFDTPVKALEACCFEVNDFGVGCQLKIDVNGY